MSTYIILSTFEEETLNDPADLIDRAEEVTARLDRDCPDVDWIDSYGTTGSYDVVDILKAEKPAQVQRAAMIIRSYGGANTETMTAVPWEDLVDQLR